MHSVIGDELKRIFVSMKVVEFVNNVSIEFLILESDLVFYEVQLVPAKFFEALVGAMSWSWFGE